MTDRDRFQNQRRPWDRQRNSGYSSEWDIEDSSRYPSDSRYGYGYPSDAGYGRDNGPGNRGYSRLGASGEEDYERYYQGSYQGPARDFGSGRDFGSERGGSDRGGSDRGGSDRGYRQRDWGHEGDFGHRYESQRSDYERFDRDRERNQFPYRGNAHSSQRAQPYGSSSGQYGDSGQRSRGMHEGRGPKGYTRTDERIREDVCDALMMHPDLDASEIEVRVSEGEVTLTGTVSDRQDKFVAESVSDSVPGVRDVHNTLRTQRGKGRDSKSASSSSSSANEPSERSARNGAQSSSAGTSNGPRT